MKKKLVATLAVVVATLAAGSAGMYWYRMVWLPKQELLPAFIDPPAGPRGPAYSLGGFAPRTTTLDDAKQILDGVACTDTSMRAMMQAKRDAVLASLGVKSR